MGMTEADFARELAVAAETSRRLDMKEPRATPVSFDQASQAVRFDLRDGAAVILPLVASGLDALEGTDMAAARSSAARANGAKGGRPRKLPPAAGE
jgi:hypothetical protein